MLIEAAVCVVAIAVLLVAVLFWMERAERRRRSRWWREYFHNGGLVGVLMRRWTGPKRLTDRPEDHA
ncbi:hypothetical protein [Sphingomonas sp. 1P08PE]|uniref:hypothetical protein n=1 Tax=Sphingomonas sp. 1P08PE TaxID=554122 RepID=UPI0039A20757